MIRKVALGAVAISLAGSALAQSTDGFGSIIRVPVVVNSPTYSSALTVRNDGSSTSNIAVRFHAGTGSSAASRDCEPIVLGAGATAEYSFVSLCGLPAHGGTTQYGQLVLSETNNGSVPLSVYTRVQTFTSNGFSVEGFKEGGITGSDGTSWVSGLKRQSGAPGFTSNCFIGSLGESVDVSWSLRDGSGAQIGATQNVSLAANGMTRMADVFSAAGAPAGNYNNISARFVENTAGSNPGFVAFCTVQNDTTYDADFRIAKESEPADDRLRKVVTSSTNGLGEVLTIATSLTQHVLGLHLQHPDWVQCAISSADPNDLEMRLKDPDGNVVAGGDNVHSFGDVYLGARGTRNNGVNGMWRLEIESTGLLALPLSYQVTCQTGNGTHRPMFLGTALAEF